MKNFFGMSAIPHDPATGRLYTEWINSAEMHLRSAGERGYAPGHKAMTRIYYVFAESPDQPHQDLWPDGFAVTSEYVPREQAEYLNTNEPLFNPAPPAEDPFAKLGRAQAAMLKTEVQKPLPIQPKYTQPPVTTVVLQQEAAEGMDPTMKTVLIGSGVALLGLVAVAALAMKK
jgi:hypothetical protein